MINISWYRDDDKVIITDEEFGSDCAECSMFCQEGTNSVPCNPVAPNAPANSFAQPCMKTDGKSLFLSESACFTQHPLKD